MQSHSFGMNTRAVLLASVSVVALATASSEVCAQAAPRAPGALWWIEGGPFWTGGGNASFGPTLGIPGIATTGSANLKNGVEGAIGFDFAPGAFSPFHLSGQFRYGAARGNGGSLAALIGIPTPPGFNFTTRTTGAFVSGVGSTDLKEHHWLVDFAVGRDFGLGAGQSQVKLGIRIADIHAKATGRAGVCGNTTSFACGTGSPITGVFFFTSRSRFLGVGPRLGIDGSVPLAGSWAFDYLGGIAVLFGDRKLDSNSSLTLTINPPGGGTGTLSALTSSSKFGSVLNLDGQAGVSYWFNPNFKLSASYRVDWYQNVLRVADINGNITNQDRLYHGPMFRLTTALGGP